MFFLIFAVSAPTESLKVSKSFQDYMGEHSKLRTICEEGKGKLQWERDIPPNDLANLENLANTDFHANLGKIIHDIYLTGHNLFRYLHMFIYSVYDHNFTIEYIFFQMINIFPLHFIGTCHKETTKNVPNIVLLPKL